MDSDNISDRFFDGAGSCIERCFQEFGMDDILFPDETELKRKEKSVEQLFQEGKSVPKVRKVLKDRLDRRMKLEKLADFTCCLFMMKSAGICPPILDSLNLIQENWPLRVELNNLYEELDKIIGNARPDEMKQRLKALELKIKNLKDREKEDLEKANNIVNLFLLRGEEVSLETLKKELSSAFPWLFIGETATHGRKRRRTPPEASQQKEKSLEELLKNKKKSFKGVIKIFTDRVNRRIIKDKMADLKYCIYMMKFAQISPSILDTIDVNIWESRWPLRPDLQIITAIIKDMEAANVEVPMRDEDMVQRLQEVEERIQMSDKERVKVALEANKLHVKVRSPEILRQKCSEAFPWLFKGKPATNRPIADQGQGSGQLKYSVKNVEELEKELFDNNKKRVGFSDFQGLKEEVSGAGALNLPMSLEPFATRIREACGEQIAEDAYFSILIFFSAAVRDMEKCEGIHQLNLDRLLKWVATYNAARKIDGLQLQFFKDHLKKLFYAYLYFEFQKRGECFELPKGKGGDPEEWVRQAEAGVNVVNQCISARKYFKEKPLIHGLFP